MKQVTYSSENDGKKAEAMVSDYSDGKDGSKNITVDYDFSFDVLETEAELKEKYSLSDLLALANARIKSTANSGARQKTIAPYAQDPNSQGAIRERMVKDAMKLGKTKEAAEAFVDSLLNA